MYGNECRPNIYSEVNVIFLLLFLFGHSALKCTWKTNYEYPATSSANLLKVHLDKEWLDL